MLIQLSSTCHDRVLQDACKVRDISAHVARILQHVYVILGRMLDQCALQRTMTKFLSTSHARVLQDACNLREIIARAARDLQHASVTRGQKSFHYKHQQQHRKENNVLFRSMLAPGTRCLYDACCNTRQQDARLRRASHKRVLQQASGKQCVITVCSLTAPLDEPYLRHARASTRHFRDHGARV